MASGTVARSIMFACTDHPSPVRWPASAMQRSPVWVATAPDASTTATWRLAANGSSEVSAASAASGASPAASRSSRRDP
jgi:hypothetical protein